MGGRSKKWQVDMENRVVYIPDSKTANGVGEIPISDLAYRAFQAQIEATPASEYLFPTPRQKSSRPYIRSLKNIWAATLRRAGVPHFPLYELRHTFATRLSAGGVADHFVTQMLRQGDSAVFQALQPGEAEHDARGIDQARPPSERTSTDFEHSKAELNDFWHIFGTV